MLDMLKRHEIQVLRKAGHSQEEVAKMAEVSARTVRRIESESLVCETNTPLERKRRKIGRPTKIGPYLQSIKEILIQEPELISLEILRRIHNDGYLGSKSAAYEAIKAMRPPPAKPVVRFEGLPGEFTQHDFGHVKVRFIDGITKLYHFFASRLKYSRTAAVSIVRNEQVESLVRSMVEHFEIFGGIPLLGVFDNPKTIVIQRNADGTVKQWNSTFAGVVLDIGIGVELCWPRRGNQKGSVENLVGWVKGSFFKPRRFVDEEDMLRQLAEWHEEVNTRRPSRATGEIPAVRLIEDRKRLRPLKVKPAELALPIPVVVGMTGEVLHDTHYYTMPPKAMGLPGTLYLYPNQVRIVAGRFEAKHARLFVKGAKSSLPSHRSEMLAAVSGTRGERYLKRQHLLELGGGALEYLTEIIHRRNNRWMHDIDGLHDLLQKNGPDSLRRAIEQALQAQVYGVEYVRHFLEADTLNQVSENEMPLQPDSPANIAGEVRL